MSEIIIQIHLESIHWIERERDNIEAKKKNYYNKQMNKRWPRIFLGFQDRQTNNG